MYRVFQGSRRDGLAGTSGLSTNPYRVHTSGPFHECCAYSKKYTRQYTFYGRESLLLLETLCATSNSLLTTRVLIDPHCRGACAEGLRVACMSRLSALRSTSCHMGLCGSGPMVKKPTRITRHTRPATLLKAVWSALWLRSRKPNCTHNLQGGSDIQDLAALGWGIKDPVFGM